MASRKFLLSAALAVLCLAAMLKAEGACTRTYTFDADFDQGILVGVEHETVHDQLQLSRKVTTLPFIWIPNNNGTVSKVDTESGDELGRYCVAPHSDCSPSRTTVDLEGNCYVGNRQAGTVVKIGLYEAGAWVDRNGDGVCQTSHDTNGDGDIAGDEILPWGKDECVLYEVVLIPGSEWTYAPGDFAGPYDYDYWGTAPRGLAVDRFNNVWAGTWKSSKYYYIEGSTGAILKVVDVSPHQSYGAVIDRTGILWSSGRSRNEVLRLDPSAAPPGISTVKIGHLAYGLALDYVGHLFVSGWDWWNLSRLDTGAAIKEWTIWDAYLYQARGVACTGDNDVWVASSGHGMVARYDNDGNWKAALFVGSEPTGVAVDAAGKVWCCNLGDEDVVRIDPATNKVDLRKSIVGSGGHYSYSDMTGIVARTITTRVGTWSVVFDSAAEGTKWGIVSWNSHQPEGTLISVKARSSDNPLDWSSWEVASNGVPLTATPDGRFLQIETAFQIVTGEVSPVLYDLTVNGMSGCSDVTIDIKPGSYPNPINLGSKGVVPVAIFSSVSFDAGRVDVPTVELAGAPVAIKGKKYMAHLEDVNGDGFLDLVLQFETQRLDAGKFENGFAILTGKTLDGQDFQGRDEVVLVPRR